VPCYLLQHADRDVEFSGFGQAVLFCRNVAVTGDIVGSQFQYVTQSAQAFGYLSDLFVHNYIF
jgi:hypothetical protein